MTLSGVLFDMDGLLVDTERLWVQAEHRTMAELNGSPWTVEDQRAIMGSSMAYSAQYMRERSGTTRSAEEVSALLVGTMLGLLEHAEIDVLPGAAELVHDVHLSGLPFALVSASARTVVDLVLAALDKQGLPAFPVTIAGDEVARSKPDPLPYLTAADRLGIEIHHAVVIEDSANGVRAGRAAGATVVAIPHAVPIEPADRLHVRQSLVGLDVRALHGLVTAQS
jgi:HAD superfamily hydrolase (TIGR01509 family)